MRAFYLIEFTRKYARHCTASAIKLIKPINQSISVRSGMNVHLFLNTSQFV
jgi:hypothetical protein